MQVSQLLHALQKWDREKEQSFCDVVQMLYGRELSSYSMITSAAEQVLFLYNAFVETVGEEFSHLLQPFPISGEGSEDVVVSEDGCYGWALESVGSSFQLKFSQDGEPDVLEDEDLLDVLLVIMLTEYIVEDGFSCSFRAPNGVLSLPEDLQRLDLPSLQKPIPNPTFYANDAAIAFLSDLYLSGEFIFWTKSSSREDCDRVCEMLNLRGFRLLDRR